MFYNYYYNKKASNASHLVNILKRYFLITPASVEYRNVVMLRLRLYLRKCMLRGTTNLIMVRIRKLAQSSLEQRTAQHLWWKSNFK